MRTASFLIVLAFSAPAAAQTAGATGSADASAGFEASTTTLPPPSSSEADDGIPGALVVGGEVGVIFPQLFNKLATHVAFGLELGYRLPPLDQRIEIMFAAGYSPPWHNFDVDRAEGTYTGELDQQELTFSLGPRFRVMERDSKWNIPIAAGPRLFLLRSVSNGDRDGEEFMTYKEQSTKLGFFVAVGGEYLLGPGALFLDLDLGWSPLDHEITGDASTGNLTTTLGYRLFLL